MKAVALTCLLLAGCGLPFDAPGSKCLKEHEEVVVLRTTGDGIGLRPAVVRVCDEWVTP